MDELETLDDDLTQVGTEISPTIQKLSSETAPWIKTVAIITLVLQGIGLIRTIQTSNTTQLGIDLFVVAITVALYITLLNWGTAMEKLGKAGSMTTFSESMLRQKSFWIFFGIIWIIVMILIIWLVFTAINDPMELQRLLRNLA
jgi:predicted membrane channel-forming protein YqfA (hemolysin III family)